MARINPNQLRTWQNGDIIPASDYNQERNLIIEANNDTNDKANLATQNAQNAIDRVNRLELQPTRVEETSTYQRLEITLSEGQQVIQLPAPGYLPNTNRVTLHIDGILTPVTETSPTAITLQSPARAGQSATVQWVTELPRVFDIERIEQTIRDARTVWLPEVTRLADRPQTPPSGAHIFVQEMETVYRFEDGAWKAIYKAPRFVGDTLTTRRNAHYTAQSGQLTYTLPDGDHYVQGQNRLDVYISGVKQRPGADYTEQSTNSFTLTSPAPTGADVEVVYLTSSQALAEDLRGLVNTAMGMFDLSDVDGGGFLEGEIEPTINGGVF